MDGSQSSLAKSLSLLVRVLEEPGASTLSGLARAAGMPISTTHRLLDGLQRAGFVSRLGRDRFVGGPTLRRLARLQLPARQILVEASRPILAELSRRASRISHLSILEDNMMTYLVKEGDPENRVPSRPDVQLEAYCAGVGKVLLAYLPSDEREAYLATAPFVALTPRTITSADGLREEFARIRQRGYGLDNAEMFDGFICIAVPVRVGDRVVAAISLVVTQIGEPCRPVAYLARMQVAAAQLEARLAPFADMFATATDGRAPQE